MRRVLALQLRRDRVVLSVWIVAIAVTLAGSAATVASEFATASERTTVLSLSLATPSLLALRGNPNGASAGSLLFFDVFTFLAVAFGLMNTFFATRHGRADEEQGRRELIAASPIRRSAPLVSTALLGLAADAVLSLLSALGFIAAGYGGAGAWVAAAALGAIGLCFLGIGMLAGELAATSRAANSIGVVAVLLAYALRAAGDALGTPHIAALTLDPGWPSWLSPIGWGQQTLAFTENRIWPVLLLLALAVAAGGTAFAVHARRDLGASLLPERDGRAIARRSLRSLLGLDWRLHWPSVLGWAVGAALLGVATGALASAADDLVAGNAQVLTVLEQLSPSGGVDTAGLFIETVMIMIGMLAAAAGIQAVLRLRGEEAEGRAELVLAAPVGRVRWLGDSLIVGAVATSSVAAAAGLAAALGFAATGHSVNGWHALGQAFAELPAAVTMVAVAAVLIAVLPRISTLGSWVIFAAVIVIGLFGQLLKLPQAVRDASPFSHVPTVPFTDWGPSLVLTAVAFALAAVALVLVRRRDLST